MYIRCFCATDNLNDPEFPCLDSTRNVIPESKRDQVHFSLTKSLFLGEVSVNHS